MGLAGGVHRVYAAPRRARVLARRIAAWLPPDAAVLDVGCGDGQLATLIVGHRPDIRVRGLDVDVRPGAAIPVERFDGARLPATDRSIDVVLFVDVLHHASDPLILLDEAVRVARHSVIVKDHVCHSALDLRTLQFMDRVSNCRHGMEVPESYWSEQRWREVLGRLGGEIRHWDSRLGLYPWWAGWLFDRKLHCLVQLLVQRESAR